MLFATASQAALERSSTGRMRTWFRTPTRPSSRRYPRNVALLRSMLDLKRNVEWLSPALGLDIVHVGVLTHLDGRNRASDVHAVLDHRVAAPELADRELVAYGDVALRPHLDLPVLVHDPSGQFLPCLHALHDDHSHGVVLIVHHEMNHGRSQRQNRLPAFGSTGRVQSWMLILRVGSDSGARTHVLPSGPSR